MPKYEPFSLLYTHNPQTLKQEVAFVGTTVPEWVLFGADLWQAACGMNSPFMVVTNAPKPLAPAWQVLPVDPDEVLNRVDDGAEWFVHLGLANLTAVYSVQGRDDANGVRLRLELYAWKSEAIPASEPEAPAEKPRPVP